MLASADFLDCQHWGSAGLIAVNTQRDGRPARVSKATRLMTRWLIDHWLRQKRFRRPPIFFGGMRNCVGGKDVSIEARRLNAILEVGLRPREQPTKYSLAKLGFRTDTPPECTDLTGQLLCFPGTLPRPSSTKMFRSATK